VDEALFTLHLRLTQPEITSLLMAQITQTRLSRLTFGEVAPILGIRWLELFNPQPFGPWFFRLAHRFQRLCIFGMVNDLLGRRSDRLLKVFFGELFRRRGQLAVEGLGECFEDGIQSGHVEVPPSQNEQSEVILWIECDGLFRL